MTTAQRPTSGARDADTAPGDEPRPAFVGAARAVFGLVDDQYGVVAHTPNLTREQAHALCRAVGIGDPAAPIDDALSFLEVPGWGFVCTRYATQHDARGRLALVSDSVAVDAASFRELRADPFRWVPRRGDLTAAAAPNAAPPNAAARPLDVPILAAGPPAADGERLAAARTALDEPRELRPLLAALLAGERVLAIAPQPPTQAVLRCLVLLLPPSLRRLMTFQTAATRPSANAPRLTASDRRYAELGAAAWSRELPREIGVADPRADAAADALLALAPAALAAAHATYESLAEPEPPPAALLAEVERVVRHGALATALAERAPIDALRAVAGARDDGELRMLADSAFAAFAPEAVGAAVGALLSERAAESDRAGARLVVELLRREGLPGADAAGTARALDAALASCDRMRWTPDPDARRAQAALAMAAARRGDGERLVQLAEVDAPWTDLALSPPRAASAATRLTDPVVAEVARARAGDADAAVAALDAVGALASTLGAPGRRDAAGLALAVASRAVATNAAAHDGGAPARLRRVADALTAFWDRVPPADARGEAVRRLLRGAPDAADRALDGMPADERAGWLVAATLRALGAGGGVGAIAKAIAAAIATGGPGDAALPRTLGALLVAAATDGPPLHDGWPALLESVDADARQALLVRALARTTHAPVPLDELAATCAALADLDFRLDVAAADDLAPSLGRWAATLPPTRAAAARLGAALGLLGELADTDAAARLASAALREASEPLRSLVQLRRLAASAAEVEATRDPGTWAALRAALATRGAALLPAQRAALRDFLGVRDHETLLGRIRREVTR